MRIVGAAFMLVFFSACLGAQVAVEGVRMWPAPDHTRVVFDISGSVEHTLFSLKNPERVVIDIRGVRMPEPVPRPESTDNLIRRVRTAVRNRNDLRVVLDLKRAAQPKSFLLKPNRNYGYRLVIDLFARMKDGAGQRRVAKSKSFAPSKLRDVVIAIDPGHGGEDPGAMGGGGTLEKDVVLAISRRLHTMINRDRGMRAVMVRRGDYYVGLRKRMAIAREHRADLFVSIHADGFKTSQPGGSSVYVLSRNGASSEAAKWLADRENSADLVGGVSLDDKDDLLASVLLDLSQTATLSASAELGSKVLEELKKLAKPHKRRVQRAGFAVLKSPDIPSILIETAFISNPHEERKLRNPHHQRQLAKAILKGIRGYFENNAPPETLLATRRHVIGKGDTLSTIAERYQVSMDHLRTVNGLPDDQIKRGEILEIPQAQGS